MNNLYVIKNGRVITTSDILQMVIDLVEGKTKKVYGKAIH